MKTLIKRENKVLKTLVVFPVIFSVFVPIVILDFWVELYQLITFPICKIPKVKRSDFIKIDRHKLPYLNIRQKIYCAYCGYVNGVFGYWVEVGARTEEYWCGIQHKKIKNFKAPKHHEKFTEYGNAMAFQKAYATIPKEKSPDPQQLAPELIDANEFKEQHCKLIQK